MGNQNIQAICKGVLQITSHTIPLYTPLALQILMLTQMQSEPRDQDFLSQAQSLARDLVQVISLLVSLCLLINQGDWKLFQQFFPTQLVY